MKKMIKAVGYVLFFLLYIWATVRVQFCWFEWFYIERIKGGFWVALVLCIVSIVLTIVSVIVTWKRKTLIAPVILFFVFFLLILFSDHICNFLWNHILSIGPGGLLPRDNEM